MKTILERLKSPVVIAQLVSIIGGLIVVLNPSVEVEVKAIVGAIVAAVNVFAGLNNPADKSGF